MRTSWQLVIPSVFFCALTIQALQHDSHVRIGNESADDPGWSGLTSSMEKMHSAMAAIGPSGATDVDFVRLMLPHHQAAIDMAKTQLLYGKDPQVRRLAQEIITDQQSEIQLMQLWLKSHDSAKVSKTPFRGDKENQYEDHPLVSDILLSLRLVCPAGAVGSNGHSRVQPRSHLRGKPDLQHGFGD